MKKPSPRMIELLRRLENTSRLVWWNSAYDQASCGRGQAYYGGSPVTATVKALMGRGLVSIVLDSGAKDSNGHVEITQAGITYLESLK